MRLALDWWISEEVEVEKEGVEEVNEEEEREKVQIENQEKES